MEFLKKNWAKIVLAAISFAGVVLIFIPMITAPEFNFIGASQLLGVFLFFLGVTVFVIMKMFDMKKIVPVCVLLATGILTTTFLCIGIAGFNKNMDNAQGAMGKSYANFSSEVANTALGKLAIGSEGKLVFETVEEAEETLANAKGALTVINGIDVAILGGLTTVGQVSAVNPALYAGIYAITEAAATTIDGAPLTTVKGNIIAKAGDPEDLGRAVTNIEMVLSAIEENQKSADVGAMALLFTYITMILGFGLFPTVFAVKKLVSRKDK